MIVEKGVPRHEPTFDDSGPGVLASTGVGKTVGQGQTGLPGEEAGSGEDDDDDDDVSRQTAVHLLSMTHMPPGFRMLKALEARNGIMGQGKSNYVTAVRLHPQTNLRT